MKNKLVIIALVGANPSAEILEIGKKLRFRFRLASMCDKAESCDFIAVDDGVDVPDVYSEIPQISEEQVEELLNGQEVEGEPREVELSMESISELTKKELVSLAKSQGLELSSEDKKNKDNLLTAFEEFLN